MQTEMAHRFVGKAAEPARDVPSSFASSAAATPPGTTSTSKSESGGRTRFVSSRAPCPSQATPSGCAATISKVDVRVEAHARDARDRIVDADRDRGASSRGTPRSRSACRSPGRGRRSASSGTAPYERVTDESGPSTCGIGPRARGGEAHTRAGAPRDPLRCTKSFARRVKVQPRGLGDLVREGAVHEALLAERGRRPGVAEIRSSARWYEPARRVGPCMGPSRYHRLQVCDERTGARKPHRTWMLFFVHSTFGAVRARRLLRAAGLDEEEPVLRQIDRDPVDVRLVVLVVAEEECLPFVPSRGHDVGALEQRVAGDVAQLERDGLRPERRGLRASRPRRRGRRRRRPRASSRANRSRLVLELHEARARSSRRTACRSRRPWRGSQRRPRGTMNERRRFIGPP